jgi:hypothetical protein
VDAEEVYEDCNDAEVSSAYEPGYFTWITPVILGVQVIEEMGRAVVDGLNGLKLSLCYHENYRLQREAFTAEAARELEAITEGVQEN